MHSCIFYVHECSWLTYHLLIPPYSCNVVEVGGRGGGGGAFCHPALPFLLLPPYPSSPHSPPHVKPPVMMTFVLQEGRSPLLVASNEGHLDVVKTLIGAGANVNQTRKVGVFTLLFVL